MIYRTLNTGLLSWIFDKTYLALNKVLQANLDATALEKQGSKKPPSILKELLGSVNRC